MDNYKENIIRILLSLFLIGIWMFISLEIFNYKVIKFELGFSSHATTSLIDQKEATKNINTKKSNKYKKEIIQEKQEKSNSNKIIKEKLKIDEFNINNTIQNVKEKEVEHSKQFSKTGEIENINFQKLQNTQKIPNELKITKKYEQEYLAQKNNNLKTTKKQIQNVSKEITNVKKNSNKSFINKEKNAEKINKKNLEQTSIKEKTSINLNAPKKKKEKTLKIKEEQLLSLKKSKILEKTFKETIAINNKKAQICSLKFSNNGMFLAVGRENGRLELWNGKDKKFVSYLGSEKMGHNKKINDLAFSGDSQFLVSGGDDCQIIKWDIKNRKAFRLEKIQLPILSVAISQTGDYFLAGTKNNAYFFNKNQSEPDLINHYGNVKSIAILSSKNMILTCPSGFNNRRIKPKLKIWKIPPKWPVYKYKFSGEFIISEEKNILLAWTDKKISIYNLNNKKWISDFISLNKPIKQVVFLKNSNFFLVVTKEKDFIIYNFENKKIVHQFKNAVSKEKLVFTVNPITNELVIANKRANILSTFLKLK